MTPDTDEQTARAAAEAWWAGHMNSFPGFAPTGAPAQTPRYVYEAFAAGYHAGRAAGLALAAEMVTSNFSSWDDSTYQSANRLAQAIRRAAERGGR